MGVGGVGTPILWVGFLALITAALAIDLGIVHRGKKQLTLKQSALATIVWIGLALLFNLWIYFEFGSQAAAEFLAAYLIEKALSVDNIFVFIMLFSYFAVPSNVQYRVLFFGIIGAIIFRGVFIFAGTILLQKFQWLMYVLGLLLVYTAYKLLKSQDIEVQPEKNPVVKYVRKHLPITEDFRESKFFSREGGKLFATPLFIVLIAVETTDIVFATDSIPAALAITQDAFIVFSSNIFAILGLRALYFLLAGAMRKFEYLQIGLAVVLAFIGAKMLLSGFFHIPMGWSLAVIAVTLGLSILASLVKRTDNSA